MPSDRASVLWLTPQPPDRRVGGGGVRQAHLLTSLAEVADVDLLVASPDPITDPLFTSESTGPMRSVRSIRAPADWGAGPVIRRINFIRSATTTAGPSEVFLARKCADAAAREVSAMRREVSHDVVVVQHAGLARLATMRVSGERWLAEIHRLGSVDEAQLAGSEHGRRAWLHRHESLRSAKLEQWITTTYDRVIAVSADEAAALPGSIVIPNGVDLGHFQPSPIAHTHRIVMTGAMATRPNETGAIWLCREVLPLVRALVPDVTVQLVGDAPSADVLALHDLPGVEVTGRVEDVRPWLANARLAVVPLVMGSGTRLKALEAMASGRPVVGTSIGLQGLGIQDGVQALVADKPDEFAGRVVDVLTDDDFASRLAQAGHDLVTNNHGWVALGERYRNAVLSV